MTSAISRPPAADSFDTNPSGTDGVDVVLPMTAADTHCVLMTRR